MIELKNIKQVLTLQGCHLKDGRNLLPKDCNLIKDANILFDKEKIYYVGTDTPKELSDRVSESYDLSDYIVVPEIVDCHTHLIFGGNRSFEYSMRLNGADYQEIANNGGGILESSRGTNSLSSEELFRLSCERVERINSFGVGTIEIKSGYGLGFNEEYRLSKIIHRLKDYYKDNVQIINTFMAAHAIPKGFKNSSDYLSHVCIPLLEKLADEKIIDAVDIFHETGYFNSLDVEDLFKRAISLNLPVKSHADEFQDNNGASLAVKFNAVSTDHLLCTSDQGIKDLASSDTVATLLPGTGYFLGKPQANARKLLDAGAKVAIGSDYNPGSCHCDNVLLIASLSAPNYKMNLTELWASITYNAAHALGLKKQGTILEGMKPRFSFFKTESIDEITYSWGKNFAEKFNF